MKAKRSGRTDGRESGMRADESGRCGTEGVLVVGEGREGGGGEGLPWVSQANKAREWARGRRRPAVSEEI